MKNIGEKALFFVVLVAIAAVVLVWMKPWKGWETPAAVRQTTVRVIEGVVEVFKLDARGKPREKQTLFRGETLTVRAPGAAADAGQAKAPSGNLLSPVAARAAALLRNIAAEFAGAAGPASGSRFISEEDFDRFVVRALSAKRLVSEAGFSVTAQGFDASAKLSAGPVGVPVTCRGTVRLGPDRRLYLELFHAKIGFVSVPGRILRGIEDAFDAEMANGTGPLDILDVEFTDGGVNLSYARI